MANRDEAQDHLDDPPVDLTRVKETAEGDKEFEQELFNIYLDDVEMRLGELEQQLRDGDAENVRTNAHTIKGASANVGVEGMREIAYELEKAARDGDLSHGPTLLEAMNAEFKRVQAFLGDYLNSRD